MHSIQLNKKQYLLPENWKEFKPANIARIASLYMMKLDEWSFRLKFLSLAANIPYHKLAYLPADQIYIHLVPLIKYSQTKPNLCVPYFRGLYGPQTGCANVTVLEYSTADIELRKYLKTEDENHLNRLVAILYRKKKPFLNRLIEPLVDSSYDIRKKFDDGTLDKDAAYIAKLPLYFRHSVLVYFVACIEEMPKLYPKLYPTEEEDQKSTKKGNWIDTILAIAQTPDKIDRVAKNMYIHTAMIWLHKQRELQIEADKKAEQLKKKS